MPQSTSNSFTLQILPGQPPPALPFWVPPAGYFADVPMRNNPEDVTPALYMNYPNDSSVMDNPFVIWGGSAILSDFSPLGAQVYYSGGHEASLSLPNIQFSLICDFTSLRWSVANLPLAVNPGNLFPNGYAADGTPYTPHTYLGLQELPAAWGGGAKGSLVSFFWGGSAWENRVNLLDVSRSQLGYSTLATRQAGNADPSKIRFQTTANGGNYPISVIDYANQGWWVAVNGGVNYTLLIRRTGDISQYPALGGNLANGAMALCSGLKLLVVIDGGYASGPNAGTGYRNLYIRNVDTGAMTTTTTLGPVPSLSDGYDGTIGTFHRPDAMGLQWVEELGCIVGFDQSVLPPVVVKLTPPPSNPSTTPWTWSIVSSLQHWPRDSGGQASLQTVLNNVWSKFRWVPSLHAFVYGTGKGRKPQIIKLS
jgi:hypothetical protein